MNVLPSFFPLAEQPWVNSRTEVGGRRLRRLGCTCGLSLCCAKWEKLSKLMAMGSYVSRSVLGTAAYAFLCAPDGPPQIWTQNQIILSQHFSRSQVLRSKKDTQKVKLLQESQCILSKITQNVSSSHAFFSDLLKSKSASVSSSLGPLLYLYRMEILEPASFQETGSVSYLFSFLLSRILASPLQPPATKYLGAQLLSLWYPTIWHL